MSLVANQSVGNSYSCEDFNETKQEPIEILPNELVLKLFSHLNLATLGTICCISKQWKRLRSDRILWKTVCWGLRPGWPRRLQLLL
jgi:hypothetical protein